MLDGAGRKLIDPLLVRIGERLAAAGVAADAVTWAGLALGLLAGAAVAGEWYWLAIALIAASRMCDGLDGVVARLRAATDFGGFLDIVLDFAFYGAIPLGFVLADPQANGVAGAVLLFAFYVNGASFLAYAVMAQKRGIASRARGEKSLYFTTGLAEATETLAVFIAACLFPDWFPVLAYVFAAVTLYTAASRIVLASREFRQP